MEEANSLERQIEGVQQKLAGVQAKIAFMEELESEASPELPLRSPPPRRTLTAPPLAVAMKKAAVTLRNFTKRQAIERMAEEFPMLKFNPKSLDRIIQDMIKKDELVILPKSADQGLSHVYAYKA